jgi:hypothetical protein
MLQMAKRFSGETRQSRSFSFFSLLLAVALTCLGLILLYVPGVLLLLEDLTSDFRAKSTRSLTIDTTDEGKHKHILTSAPVASTGNLWETYTNSGQVLPLEEFSWSTRFVCLPLIPEEAWGNV